jgi:crotonobetainyl-CoA:carnitine CoA-transferase CaiB-like acyl-CoA transferase
VQNHRPGVAERFGIGEAALRGVKPDLVYVSISGESGLYADQWVYDPVIQALSGLAAIQADVETGRPHMIRLIIPDKVTALTAVQAQSSGRCSQRSL